MLSPTLRRPTKVYVVDDHQLVREGLRRILSGHSDLKVGGVTGSGSEALADLSREPADLVLIDFDLGSEPNGPELCRTLSGGNYRLSCLGMLAKPQGGQLREFLGAGARGVLLKDADSFQIMEAVRVVISGQTYLDPRLTPLVMEAMGPSQSPAIEALNPVEQAVLVAMAEGLSNHEIGETLSMSLGAVKGHVSHLLIKLQASSRTEAVAVAARTGLLPAGPR